jgi:hypothetical protein
MPQNLLPPMPQIRDPSKIYEIHFVTNTSAVKEKELTISLTQICAEILFKYREGCCRYFRRHYKPSFIDINVISLSR